MIHVKLVQLVQFSDMAVLTGLHPQSLTWNIMQPLNWNYMALNKDVSTGLLVIDFMEDCF
jgi:hypothetical protein